MHRAFISLPLTIIADLCWPNNDELLEYLSKQLSISASFLRKALMYSRTRKNSNLSETPISNPSKVKEALASLECFPNTQMCSVAFCFTVCRVSVIN